MSKPRDGSDHTGNTHLIIQGLASKRREFAEQVAREVKALLVRLEAGRVGFAVEYIAIQRADTTTMGEPRSSLIVEVEAHIAIEGLDTQRR